MYSRVVAGAVAVGVGAAVGVVLAEQVRQNPRKLKKSAVAQRRQDAYEQEIREVAKRHQQRTASRETAGTL